jgi:hypothetical protein
MRSSVAGGRHGRVNPSSPAAGRPGSDALLDRMNAVLTGLIFAVTALDFVARGPVRRSR